MISLLGLVWERLSRRRGVVHDNLALVFSSGNGEIIALGTKSPLSDLRVESHVHPRPLRHAIPCPGHPPSHRMRISNGLRASEPTGRPTPLPPPAPP